MQSGFERGQEFRQQYEDRNTRPAAQVRGRIVRYGRRYRNRAPHRGTRSANKEARAGLVPVLEDEPPLKRPRLFCVSCAFSRLNPACPFPIQGGDVYPQMTQMFTDGAEVKRIYPSRSPQ